MTSLERLCCSWCGQDRHLSRCSRCHNAFYCSREHQKAHWHLHRSECVEKEACHASVSKDGSSWTVQPVCSQTICNPSVDDLETIQQFNALEALVDNSLIQFPFFDNTQKTDTYDTSQHVMQDRPAFESVNDDSFYLEQAKCTSYTDSSISSETTLKSTMELDQMCKNLIKDMNEYGICVIDNFLGKKCGDAILQEVRDLYQSGHFREGQLVSNRGVSKAIRGDWITWVDGTESGCQTVGELIKKLDAIITMCNKMANNGILKNYKITTRTKAMIACYPGSGTRYVKHVDNPNNDGRCVTCIYYLNKEWDAKHHGGLLQMFPTGLNSQVANIEPFFDRIIFFWSDRRNPHEVQPSFKIRFAITVWYFDFEERQCALRKYQSSGMLGHGKN